MKLYYAPGACSLADHLALEESGLPYQVAKIDLRAKTTEDGRDFTAINPKGYVPALELDEGAILTENVALLGYIAATSGTLMPPEGLAHWRAIEALAFISTELHKNFKPFFMPSTSQADKDAAGAMLAKRFATIAEPLETTEYLVGDTLSVADCYLFVTLLWARKNGLPLPGKLDAYADRLKARPAFAKVLAAEGLGG